MKGTPSHVGGRAGILKDLVLTFKADICVVLSASNLSFLLDQKFEVSGVCQDTQAELLILQYLINAVLSCFWHLVITVS